MLNRLYPNRLGIVAVLVAAFFMRPATAAENPGPPQIYARVMQVQDDIRHLSNKMGKPNAGSPVLQVSKALPHDSFFQALGLLQKANRLSYEHTRQRARQPQTPEGELRSAHVLALVNMTLERLQDVKGALGIASNNPYVAPDNSKTSTDVSNAILQTNRQLNRLLDQGVSLSHVLQQVTTASEYAAQLLTRFPQVAARPAPPAFQSEKRLSDIFYHLLNCVMLVRQSLDASGLNMLTLQVNGDQISEITPSDVFDLGAILMAQLAYLHSQAPDVLTPTKIYRRQQLTLPAHVYQHVGVLATQLGTLRAQVGQHPTWLRTADSQ